MPHINGTMLYLAGSFADAQRRARAEIARRERMLFQAERLKTLRAMSVAVIHDLSQPLSTLSLEAKNLAAITDKPDTAQAEIAESVALVERQTRIAAEMVRRLRRFGERQGDEDTPVMLAGLMEDVGLFARAEARRRAVRLDFEVVDPALCVAGQETELMQAVANLVNNAIAASPEGGRVGIAVAAGDREVRITITNAVDGAGRTDAPGMGVGLMIARTIVDAHGGRITQEGMGTGHVVHVIALPRLVP